MVCAKCGKEHLTGSCYAHTVINSSDYERGYQQGFKDGFNQGQSKSKRMSSKVMY